MAELDQAVIFYDNEQHPQDMGEDEIRRLPGVVLYEMVTGRLPFTGETTSLIAVAILENEPVPISRFALNAASELQRIVRKSLAKDHEERYQMTTRSSRLRFYYKQ